MMLSIILLHLVASIFATSEVGITEKEDPIGTLETLYSAHNINYDFTLRPELAADYNNGGYRGVLLAGAKFLNGRLFVSFPRWSDTVPATFGTLDLTTGLVSPFPSWEVNDYTNPDLPAERKLYSVLGFEFSEDNRIFVLDQGKVCDREAEAGSIKVLVLSSAGEVLESYPMSQEIASTFNSFVNDLVYDPVRQFLYISDCGKPITEQGKRPVEQDYAGQIISLDLKTGKYRTFLKSTVFTNPDKDYVFEIREANYLTYTGVDGIALTNDGEYLYFCPLTSDKLYRIKTSYLREDHKAGDLDDKVETVMTRPSASDGLMIDGSNNMYLTGIETFTVYIYESSLLDTENNLSNARFLPLVTNYDTLGWCDTLGFDDDGSITVVSNNLDLFDQGQMFANEDINQINFRISRISAGATPYWRNILRIQEVGDQTEPSSGVSVGAAVGIGIGCFILGMIPFIVIMVMKYTKKGGASKQSLVRKQEDKDDGSSSFGTSSKA